MGCHACVWLPAQAACVHNAVDEFPARHDMSGYSGTPLWKKLGGGCFSTVLIFLLLFWLLGYVF